GHLERVGTPGIGGDRTVAVVLFRRLELNDPVATAVEYQVVGVIRTGIATLVDDELTRRRTVLGIWDTEGQVAAPAARLEIDDPLPPVRDEVVEENDPRVGIVVVEALIGDAVTAPLTLVNLGPKRPGEPGTTARAVSLDKRLTIS